MLVINLCADVLLLKMPATGCLRRGTGGDRDPRRWGKRETIPNAALSPPERLLVGSDERHFNVPLIVRGKDKLQALVYDILPSTTAVLI